jgi:hypothetical protein
MPVFQDTPARSFELPPEGDQILRVVNFEIGISTGAKTRGSDQYTVEFCSEANGASFEVRLQNHASTWWKVDNWLKGSGVALTKGQAFEFRQDLAEKNGVTWVNPIGLRCHAKVVHRPGTRDPKVKFAEVAVFYTDRPKLAPHVEESADDAPAVDGW